MLNMKSCYRNTTSNFPTYDDGFICFHVDLKAGFIKH